MSRTIVICNVCSGTGSIGKLICGYCLGIGKRKNGRRQIRNATAAGINVRRIRGQHTGRPRIPRGALKTVGGSR